MSGPHLQLGALHLPLDAVTQTFGLLGRKGSGKTNAAGVLAEAMLDVSAQVVALDPVGVWWGLRLASDGKSPGYEIPILGGERGDVPIEPAGGALIARTLVEKQLSAVLDVSGFRKGQRKQFVTDFAEELFHRKKTTRSPLHLILEEAQVFVPQQGMRGEERMLGAFEDIVRIGRNYGIGCTMISQRPQAVNKTVLSQTEALIVLQLVGAHERKAIRDWIVATDADVGAAVDELPRLQTGEAFFWSPGWLRTFEKVQLPLKWSYDASATPKVGEKRSDPRTLAAGEVAELREAMAQVVERAEASDPTALKRKVAKLERELAVAQKAGSPPDGAVLDRARAEGARDAEQRLARVVQAFEGRMRRLSAHLEPLLAEPPKIAELVREPLDVEVHASPLKPPRPTRIPAERPTSRTETRRSVEPAEGLDGPMQRILDAVAWFEGIGIAEPSQVGVAFLAGYTWGGGGFNNPRGRLHREGLVDYRPDQRIRMTDAGRAAASQPDAPLTVEAMHARVLERLPNPERRILQPLLDAYPEAMDADALAAAAGYAAGSGGFNNPRGRLRTLGLIDYPEPGKVCAEPILFLE